MPTLFQQSVWEALQKIPKGRVSTYSEIAKFIGKNKAVRAVGTAVGKNPDAPNIPCHRVVLLSGKVGNYSGEGGAATKIKLLKKEGVPIKNNQVLDFKEMLYRFNS
ncbi:MGMT family protein [Candidatus Peregrinibacteria bacterium]|jgi:methylated-DNA-[protein]-cysteine S-methyltransferase|nr:MGMT family protein [Candidatus Peregrinibacteria bacterium]